MEESPLANPVVVPIEITWKNPSLNAVAQSVYNPLNLILSETITDPVRIESK